MTKQVIDLTPNVNGVIAFARNMLRTARPGTADERTARKLLAECNVTVADALLTEHRDRAWRGRSGATWSWDENRQRWSEGKLGTDRSPDDSPYVEFVRPREGD
ncbi:hypothetical protein GOEFS_109_00160 [Gordonia effusa NBRC 100432]|uniref:Uncharacterized protein n=1 Tax=Gordonia effusa NBRC 100432 TaxID=1077974 RepID=H0R5C0_9ACTN|nr:hypothetical protein [Gordonia effusa]GAB20271.1 hypothetical protein GOEFS_109_00160 [Gordonia effusa NBRC 100432]